MSKNKSPEVSMQRSIELALRDHRFADALGLCPDDWALVRQRIEAHQGVCEQSPDEKPLLLVDGWSLRKIGEGTFDTRENLANEICGPGEVHTFMIAGPDDAQMELSDYRAAESRWTEIPETFGTRMPVKRLGHGLRMSASFEAVGRMAEDDMSIELGQARIKNSDLWSNVYKANTAELDHGAGCAVLPLLEAWGAKHFGTRENVLGDQSRRRGYVCVTCPQHSDELLAIAFFLTRVLPLARGVKAK